MKEEKPVFQGDIVRLTHKGRHVLGCVEISGHDADAEMEELASDSKLDKDHCKVYTHPDHELIEQHMNNVEMVDRAVLPGDIVRKNGSPALGTVLSVTSHASLRVLETAKTLPLVDCGRLRPIVRLNEEDRVEYKGWLGMVRELQEDRIIIETEDGVVNLDSEDENDRIDPEFRYLSIAGVYESIPEWRRGEEDSGIFLNQQVIGNVAPDGSPQIGKIVTIENGDAEITWVASGNSDQQNSDPPKNRWPHHELGLLRAPWTEEVAHSEVNAPSLGSRFTIALTKSEADNLNIQEAPLACEDEDEVEMEFCDVQAELIQETKDDGIVESDFKEWTLVRIGKYAVIFHEGAATAKFPNDKNNDFIEQVGSILCPETENEDESEIDKRNAQEEAMTQLMKDFPGPIEIISGGWSYTPRSLEKWSKKKYNAKNEVNPGQLEDILSKLRGQGHPQRTFESGELVTVEVDDVRMHVQWQCGTVETVSSVALVPALHINEHDFCPGDFVVRRESTNRDLSEYGCVVAADNQERLLRVKWSTKKQVEEVCAFDVDEHQDYRHIRVGELVVYSSTEKEDPVHAGVSGVGSVLNVTEDGLLSVKWTDGTVTAISPGEVISEHLLFGDDFVPANEDDDGLDELEEEDDWESCDSDSSSSGIDVKELNEQIVRDMEEDGKMPEEMRERLLKYAQGSGDSNVIADVINEIKKDVKGVQEENDDLVEQNQEQLAEILENDENDNEPPSMAEVADKQQLISEEMPDPTHAFVNKSTQSPKRSYLKIYQSEVKRLSTALPKGIQVTTYESRVDLLSWLIEGPQDTPYYHCLFAFDACLKPDHPMTAPKVSYKSMIGKKINPNLYEDGTVCLSLLGTWSGKEDSEEWNVNSNILQLVVSIQGMVLTASPYYNEAGYDKQQNTASGELNSKNYNELVLVRLCEHVAASIKNPPAPYKQFYNDFYFERGHLEAFIESVRGIMDGKSDVKYSILPISKGCQLSLEAQTKRLEELLLTKGQSHTSPIV